MSGPGDRWRALARQATGRHRWLTGAVLAMLLTTALLDPTTGSSRAASLLDDGLQPGPRVEAGVEPAPAVAAPAPGPGTGTAADLTGPTRGASPPAADPGTDPGPTPPPTFGAPVGDDLAPPAPVPAPSPPPCASAEVIAALDAAQASIESTTGQHLAVEVGDLVAGLTGCGEEGDLNPLDALGVIGQVLDVLGVESVPLPALPPLPLPSPPPPGLDALGPVVLPVCANAIQQMVTVAAVAPLARISTTDVIALFEPVIEVCALFAPRA